MKRARLVKAVAEAAAEDVADTAVVVAAAVAAEAEAGAVVVEAAGVATGKLGLIC